MSLIDKIVEKRLMPIGILDRVEDAVPLAEAVLAGGLNALELPLRTEAAFDCLAAIAKAFPDMLLGAGTVLDADILPRLQDIGVQFAVAPGLTDSTVEKAHELGMPIFPGVMTPSEVERALNLDVRILKFFPAEPAGGVNMLKALAGPFAHTGVKFLPTGGINAEKAAAYFPLSIVAAVGGSWFVARDLVESQNFAEITRRTAQALALAEG